MTTFSCDFCGRPIEQRLSVELQNPEFNLSGPKMISTDACYRCLNKLWDLVRRKTFREPET